MRSMPRNVEIPKRLNADAFQPYSIIPNGEWINLGTSSISAENIKDPGLALIKSALMPPSEAGADQTSVPSDAIEELNALLAKVNEWGYTLSRKQRYEVVDHYGVPAGHQDMMQTDVYLGVQYDASHFHRPIDVLGLNLGVAELSKNSMSINAFPVYSDMTIAQIPDHSSFASDDAEGEEKPINENVLSVLSPNNLSRNNRRLSTDNHANNRLHLSGDVKLKRADGKMIEKLHAQPLSFEMNGGDTGARYVVYQLVDHISITRDFEMEGYSSTVYEGEFRHAVFTTRYPYGD